MDIGLMLILLAMGAGGGFAAGLLGIGGGMVLVPFITMIFTAKGFPPQLVVHMAIATSLATIMFTSLSSVRAHHKHGAVQWRIVALLAPGIVVGSWIGPWIGKQMNTSALSLLFAGFVTFSAVQMLRNKKPAAGRELPGAPGMFAAGGVIAPWPDWWAPAAALFRCRSWRGVMCASIRRLPPARHWAFRSRCRVLYRTSITAGRSRACRGFRWVLSTCRRWP